MKPETYTKLIIIVVIIIFVAVFRWQVLSEGVLGNTFSSFLSTFPFFDKVITSYGTLHNYFTKVDGITYKSFLDSTMKTIIMILVQSPINKLFNAIFIPVKSGRSMYPWALSNSEQIDIEEEHINSSWYKTKEIYSNLLASLTVTMFVSTLTIHLSDAFSQIGNNGLSSIIETVLVILMLVASILVLRDSSHLGLPFSLVYRIISIALKYGFRCVSNVFILKIALELLSQNFKANFSHAVVAIVINITG